MLQPGHGPARKRPRGSGTGSLGAARPVVGGKDSEDDWHGRRFHRGRRPCSVEGRVRGCRIFEPDLPRGDHPLEHAATDRARIHLATEHGTDYLLLASSTTDAREVMLRVNPLFAEFAQRQLPSAEGVFLRRRETLAAQIIQGPNVMAIGAAENHRIQLVLQGRDAADPVLALQRDILCRFHEDEIDPPLRDRRLRIRISQGDDGEAVSGDVGRQVSGRRLPHFQARAGTAVRQNADLHLGEEVGLISGSLCDGRGPTPADKQQGAQHRVQDALNMSELPRKKQGHCRKRS